MITELLLALLCGTEPASRAPRVIELGTRSSVGVAAAQGRTNAPLPVGWGGAQTVLNQAESIVLRAPKGRKFKSVRADRDGVVELRPVDPKQVRMTGVGIGLIRVTVETAPD